MAAFVFVFWPPGDHDPQVAQVRPEDGSFLDRLARLGLHRIQAQAAEDLQGVPLSRHGDDQLQLDAVHVLRQLEHLADLLG
ncbi:MAG: hypothetical protein AMXMBFR34_47090 [Myxococcaceae bacterium]